MFKNPVIVLETVQLRNGFNDKIKMYCLFSIRSKIVYYYKQDFLILRCTITNQILDIHMYLMIDNAKLAENSRPIA